MLDRPRTRSAAAWAFAALALAGCSNDPNRIDYRSVVSGVAAQFGGTLPFDGKTAGAQQAQSLAAPSVILAQTEAPVILVQPQNGAGPFYIVGIRDNGPWRTYATGARQTLVLRQGVVTATRGLGGDLMASEIDPMLELLRANRAGKARRVMQVLDGEDVTRQIVLDCTLSVGTQVRTTTGIAGRAMTEDCASDDLSFRNSYVVDRAGNALQSEQWLPTSQGRLTLTVLRP